MDNTGEGLSIRKDLRADPRCITSFDVALVIGVKVSIVTEGSKYSVVTIEVRVTREDGPIKYRCMFLEQGSDDKNVESLLKYVRRHSRKGVNKVEETKRHKNNGFDHFSRYESKSYS